mmetsp:Transcript_61026/g.120767  ORF Transcript_61026/g.120767 Transcript_61026/m.120767 type:complete len:283 (-) Transcript_61026:135-983(-)
MERHGETLEDLVAARFGRDELGIGFDVSDDALLIVAQAEEVGRLLHLLEVLATHRVLVVAGSGVGVSHEGLLPHVVPAAVRAQVEVTGLLTPLPQLAAQVLVVLRGGANVPIELAAYCPIEVLELRHALVDELYWGHAGRSRSVGNLLAMLISASQEEYLAAIDAVVTRDHVGGDRLVRMPHVWRAVRIVDGSGDVEVAELGDGWRRVDGRRLDRLNRRQIGDGRGRGWRLGGRGLSGSGRLGSGRLVSSGLGGGRLGGGGRAFRRRSGGRRSWRRHGKRGR